MLKKWLPATDWLAEYRPEWLKGDIAAGLTVAVMLIPQAMAYAVLAGLPPIYGLYCSLAPLVVYALLGTSRHISFGPAAINMLMVAAGVGALAKPGSQEYIELAILLGLITGVIEIAMGLGGLGFLVNFLSRPVIAGFMAAAPLLIAFSQVGKLAGFNLPENDYPYQMIWDAAVNLPLLHWPTFVVGISGVIVLLVLDWWKSNLPGALILVVLSTVVSWLMGLDARGVATVGQVPGGLPDIEVPAWNWADVKGLAPTAITLVMYQFMVVMSLGKGLADERDYSVDANKELIAMGGANSIGSFFQAVPTSGSISRTGVNVEAGANTPLSNIITAVIVGITLLFLTPLFQHLPISVLSAIIIVASMGMINIAEIRALLTTRRVDGAVALLTFATTAIIGVRVGIAAGIGASVLIILYDLTRPNIAELGRVPGTREFRDVSRFPEAESIYDIHIMRIDARLTFTNAELLKEKLLSKGKNGQIRAIIIDATGVNDLDATTCSMLTDVAEELAENDVQLYVVGAKGPVRDVMVRSGLHKVIGEENFFLNTHRAVKHIVSQRDEEDEYAGIEYERKREQVGEAKKRLEKERRRMEKRRDQMEAERERMEEEHEQLQKEREKLRAQRDKLEEERNRLESEQERVERRREQMEAQRDRMENEWDQMESKQQQVRQRRRSLESSQRELDTRRQQMQQDYDELAERQQAEKDKQESD